MDLSLQHSLTLSPRNLPQRRAWLGSLGCSSSQIGLIARKSQLRAVRCRIEQGEGEMTEERPKIGSWSQGAEAATDEFSGWGVNGSQANGANFAGWVKIGGAVLLGIGFSLGARALYARKDATTMFAVSCPGIETVNPLKISENSEVRNTGDNEESFSNDEAKSVEVSGESNNTDDTCDVYAQQKSDGESIGKINDTTSFENLEQKEEPREKVEAIPVLSNAEKVEMGELATSDGTARTGTSHFVKESISAKEESTENKSFSDDSGEIMENKTFSDDSGEIMENKTFSDDSGKSTENRTSSDDSEISDITREVNLSSSSAMLVEENLLNEVLDVSEGQEESMSLSNNINLSSNYENAEKSIQTVEIDSGLEDHKIPGTELPPVEAGHSALSAGMTAPRIPTASLPKTGQVVVAASVDQMQEQIVAALQALKVIETGVEPASICTRREYARWLIGASAVLSRSPSHKVFPAMYIENVTKLAYDDVLPEDPDFPFIQGLAEAGLISSRLIQDDLQQSRSNDEIDSLFSPDSPLTRQDLITWKMALEWKPAVSSMVKEQEKLWEACGFIDIDKIHQDAIPALRADFAAGERSIIALAFGYTRRFQPEKPVSKGQVAVALASGEAWEQVTEEFARLEAESIAEAAVNAELALEKSAQQEMAAEFQGLLEAEIEKQKEAATLVENMKAELDQLKLELENENHTLLKERAMLDAEKALLSRMKHELDEQALTFSTQKLEVAFEREKADKLFAEAENEWERVHKLRSELEIEKNALMLARTWAEDEARRAQAHIKVLEETRKNSWSEESEQHVDEKQFDETINLQAAYQPSTEQTPAPSVNERSTEKRDLVELFMEAVLRLFHFVQLMFHAVKLQLIEFGRRFEQRFQAVGANCSDTATKAWENVRTTVPKALDDIKTFVPASVAGLTVSIKDGTSRAVDGWKEGAEKFVQKLKIS